MGEKKDLILVPPSNLMLVRTKKPIKLIYDISVETEQGVLYAIPIGYYRRLKEQGDDSLEEIRNPNDRKVRAEGYFLPILLWSQT